MTWEPVCIWMGLGGQPEFPRPGDGLGAVGRAELAEQVADVLLDGVEGDDELAGDGLVRLSGRQHLEHLELAAGQRVDQAGYRGGVRRGWFGPERAPQPGQVAERDARGVQEP